MSRHSRALAGLTLVIAVGVGGLILTRQMIAVAGEADAERLNRSILQYVALKNPQAPIKAFQYSEAGSSPSSFTFAGTSREPNSVRGAAIRNSIGSPAMAASSVR